MMEMTTSNAEIAGIVRSAGWSRTGPIEAAGLLMLRTGMLAAGLALRSRHLLVHGLIIAHAMKGVPYVVISVSASLANFDVRLEQAARNLGASAGQAIRRVVLPSIKPGMLAGAAFAFVTSWDELVVNLFIVSRGVTTLPRKIWNSIQDNIDPAVAAVATLLILVTLVAIITHLVLMRQATRRVAARG